MKQKSFNYFNFWQGNKIAGHFLLTPSELGDRFSQWLLTKDIDWLNYYNMTDTLNAFISEKLQAIGNTENNFAEYRAMETLLKPIRNTYINNN